MLDRGKYGADRRYFPALAEIKLVGITANVAYKVKISLNQNDIEAVKQYFSNGNNTRDKLINHIESCVEKAIKVQHQVQDYPEMTIRSFSLGNIDHYCPLSDEFGYQWASNLEIMQCYQKPNQEMEKRHCRERLNNSNY